MPLRPPPPRGRTNRDRDASDRAAVTTACVDNHHRGSSAAGTGGPIRAHVGGGANPAVNRHDRVEAQAAGAGALRWARGIRRTMINDPREEQSMHRPPAIRVIAIAGALSVLLVMLGASTVYAGQFTVASCQADRTNFSTTAFNDFATRGMTIRRACNPEGPGIRGLVTANSTGRIAVPRGSVAMVAIAAPNGTRFTTLRWAGSARRRDCRFALQLYAEGPDIKPVPIKNVRANQRCPRG